jgi:hypothetical protein
MRPRAADDFATIRNRMEELRREKSQPGTVDFTIYYMAGSPYFFVKPNTENALKRVLINWRSSNTYPECYVFEAHLKSKLIERLTGSPYTYIELEDNPPERWR